MIVLETFWNFSARGTWHWGTWHWGTWCTKLQHPHYAYHYRTPSGSYWNTGFKIIIFFFSKLLFQLWLRIRNVLGGNSALFLNRTNSDTVCFPVSCPSTSKHETEREDQTTSLSVAKWNKALGSRISRFPSGSGAATATRPPSCFQESNYPFSRYLLNSWENAVFFL